MNLTIQEKYTYNNTFIPAFTQFEDYTLLDKFYITSYQGITIHLPEELCFITDEDYSRKNIKSIYEKNTFNPENGDWNKFYKDELGIDQKDNETGDYNGDRRILEEKKKKL